MLAIGITGQVIYATDQPLGFQLGTAFTGLVMFVFIGLFLREKSKEIKSPPPLNLGVIEINTPQELTDFLQTHTKIVASKLVIRNLTLKNEQMSQLEQLLLISTGLTEFGYYAPTTEMDMCSDPNSEEGKILIQRFERLGSTLNQHKIQRLILASAEFIGGSWRQNDELNTIKLWQMGVLEKFKPKHLTSLGLTLSVHTDNDKIDGPNPGDPAIQPFIKTLNNFLKNAKRLKELNIINSQIKKTQASNTLVESLTYSTKHIKFSVDRTSKNNGVLEELFGSSDFNLSDATSRDHWLRKGFFGLFKEYKSSMSVNHPLETINATNALTITDSFNLTHYAVNTNQEYDLKQFFSLEIHSIQLNKVIVQQIRTVIKKATQLESLVIRLEKEPLKDTSLTTHQKDPNNPYEWCEDLAIKLKKIGEKPENKPIKNIEFDVSKCSDKNKADEMSRAFYQALNSPSTPTHSSSI